MVHGGVHANIPCHFKNIIFIFVFLYDYVGQSGIDYNIIKNTATKQVECQGETWSIVATQKKVRDPLDIFATVLYQEDEGEA